jgi:hypothetical protein
MSDYQETALNTDVVHNVARETTRNILQRDGKIVQTERLFTNRARYAAKTQTNPDGSYKIFGDEGGGDRGDWAYIKLLTSETQKKEYLSGSTKRDVTYKDLIGSESIVATASGTVSNTVRGYDKFLITGVACDLSEKVQISEVFGDGEVVYYFGRQPMIFNISGVLIDSPDNNWFTDWLKMYSDFLRGSQTAKNYELIKLVLPNMTLTGTISAFSWRQDSSRDVDIPFTFQFIAKLIEPKAATGPLINSNKVQGIDFPKMTAMTQSQINDLKGQVATLQGAISDPRVSLRSRGAALSALGTGVGGTFGTMLLAGNQSLRGYQSSIEGWITQENNFFNSVRTAALFQTVTSSLNGIRTNLFSPIYGILSSLTKLVTNTKNQVNNIFNALIDPVRNILRDITNISKEAIALVNLVNNSILDVGRNVTSQLRGVQSDFKVAIKSLKLAAGVIATAPISAMHSVRTMFSGQFITSDTPWLRLSPKPPYVRPSLLILKKPVPSKQEILVRGTKYSAATANVL